MDKICEHCYDDGYVWTLLGKQWGYRCFKSMKRERFYKLCRGSFYCCAKNGNLRYKLIEIDEMKKTDFCLREEKEDREEKLKEADRLEERAKANIILAGEIRKEIKEEEK